jgi:hypothetical protein
MQVLSSQSYSSLSQPAMQKIANLSVMVEFLGKFTMFWFRDWIQNCIRFR